MSILPFIPKKSSIDSINHFFEQKKLNKLITVSQQKPKSVKLYKSAKIISPVLEELFFLYNIIINNSRLTVLEFGSGFSTLIMSLALYENSKRLDSKIEKIRKKNKFELFVIENEKKYLDITIKRNKSFYKNLNIKPKINYLFSDCNVEIFNGNITHSFKRLPRCIPDLIYLDGPGQFNLKGSVNNINFAHDDFVPLSSDILKIEFLLNVGTIIIIDGRYHNANYLKLNLKRNWIYKYVEYVDKHIFYLKEKPIGFMSKKLLKFYKETSNV